MPRDSNHFSCLFIVVVEIPASGGLELSLISTVRDRNPRMIKKAALV